MPVKPKLTPWLVVRTALYLALCGLGGFVVFSRLAGALPQRAAAGFLLGLLCVEAAVPLIRALPRVRGRADFILGAVQYVAVPGLGLVLLAVALAAMILNGAIAITTLVKAGVTLAALAAMIVGYLRPVWRKYRRERDMSRQERLEALERAYREGGLSRAAYQEKREQILSGKP